MVRSFTVSPVDPKAKLFFNPTFRGPDEELPSDSVAKSTFRCGCGWKQHRSSHLLGSCFYSTGPCSYVPNGQ